MTQTVKKVLKEIFSMGHQIECINYCASIINEKIVSRVKAQEMSVELRKTAMLILLTKKFIMARRLIVAKLIPTAISYYILIFILRKLKSKKNKSDEYD
jgi:hypothetical protein